MYRPQHFCCEHLCNFVKIKEKIVHQVEHSSRLPISFVFVAILCVVSCCVPAVAQKVVVQDAGGGKKLELHYNAAGQVTETRTIAADGKLMQKDVLDYPPGATVPQTTSTYYWPNGSVRKLTRTTYDNNSNFTGEFIQQYDESGKQNAGHHLTHDPQTNVYRCDDWNVAAQDYKPIACPAAEEAPAAPEEMKKFTRDEVMQQLQGAHQPIVQRHMLEREPAAAPASSTAAAPSNTKDVGIILPAQIRTGQRVSGSVVEDPERYEGIPALTVTRVALPFSASGEASTLAGWSVEVSGEPPQPADGPIALNVPPGQVELAIALHPAGNSSLMISKAIPLPQKSRMKATPANGYQAPPVCFKDDVCLVRGAFSGNGKKTFAAFEQRPAKILAETTTAAYLAVPDATEPGPRPLVIEEGSHVIAFPMVVGEFSITPESRAVTKGENVVVTPTIEGPGELADSEWRPGNFPPWNLKQAQELIPGFQLPKAADKDNEAREAKEKGKSKSGEAAAGEEGEGGEILLVVKNTTPSQVTFRDSKNGGYIFYLKADSFSRGDFNYKFIVEPNQTGSFGVEAHVIPLLAPITGQEFSAGSGAAAKP